MRKFILMMAVMCMTVFSASAQTVEGSRLFDNVYVGLDAGAQSSLFFQDEAWGKSVLPTVGLELGKDITPVVGLSVEGFTTFNTNKDFTLVNNSNIVGNVKFNLMNLFGGYKGEPRTFEILLVPGIGWMRNYGINVYDVNGDVVGTTTADHVTYNTFAQFNFNLGKQKAWVLSIKPGVVWCDAMKQTNGRAQITLGAAYKFKNRNSAKSHNFNLGYAAADYLALKAAYEATQAELDALKGRKPEVKEVIKEVVTEKIVENTVVKTIPASAIFTFAIGKSELSKVEAAKVKEYAKQVPADATVKVVGSADTSTGSLKRNEKLAQERADVVAQTLKDNGVANVTTEIALDVNELAEACRAAIVYTK